MSDDYRLGREDGLLEAAEIVRSMADDFARRLQKPSGRWTRHARSTRHQALRNAARRISTAARRAGRRRRTKDLARAIEEAGF